LILSALLAAAATQFMLLHTEFTRLMTGDFSVMSFESGRRVLFFYVSLQLFFS